MFIALEIIYYYFNRSEWKCKKLNKKCVACDNQKSHFRRLDNIEISKNVGSLWVLAHVGINDNTESLSLRTGLSLEHDFGFCFVLFLFSLRRCL